jgi:hypothetical protein
VRTTAPATSRSLRRRSEAICSLERVRSEAGTRYTRISPVAGEGRKNEPPERRKYDSFSGMDSATMRSTCSIWRSSTSMRVPGSISTFTRTSLSSALGMNSVPRPGTSASIPASSTPVPSSTEGRCRSTPASSRP